MNTTIPTIVTRNTLIAARELKSGDLVVSPDQSTHRVIESVRADHPVLGPVIRFFTFYGGTIEVTEVRPSERLWIARG